MRVAGHGPERSRGDDPLSLSLNSQDSSSTRVVQQSCQLASGSAEVVLTCVDVNLVKCL